jgi:hypothetical protein
MRARAQTLEGCFEGAGRIRGEREGKCGEGIGERRVEARTLNESARRTEIQWGRIKMRRAKCTDICMRTNVAKGGYRYS